MERIDQRARCRRVVGVEGRNDATDEAAAQTPVVVEDVVDDGSVVGHAAAKSSVSMAAFIAGE